MSTETLTPHKHEWVGTYSGGIECIGCDESPEATIDAQAERIRALETALRKALPVVDEAMSDADAETQAAAADELYVLGDEIRAALEGEPK